MSDTLTPAALVTIIHEDQTTSLVALLDLDLDATRDELEAVIAGILKADDTAIAAGCEAWAEDPIALPPFTRPYEQGNLF